MVDKICLECGSVMERGFGVQHEFVGLVVKAILDGESDVTIEPVKQKSRKVKKNV